MGSKSKIDALDAMEELTAYRWELLRRNADYRSEYDKFFRKYLTKKEAEQVEFPRNDGSMSEEEWKEAVEAWKRLREEFGVRIAVTYKDMQEIKRVKNDPSASCHSGNGAIVVFCATWGVRYPKDYKEDFERKVDWRLFHEYGWINSAGWELPAYGILSHLDEMLAEYAINKLDRVEAFAHNQENFLASSMQSWRDNYEMCVKQGMIEEAERAKSYLEEQEKMLEVSKKNPSYSATISHLKESERVFMEDGARRRKNGERVIVINTNFSDKKIFAYVRKFLEGERKNMRRKQLRLDNQWHLLFGIWDNRQVGKTFPEIQQIIINKAEDQVGWEVSTIYRKYEKIDKKIRKMSERNIARRKA